MNKLFLILISQLIVGCATVRLPERIKDNCREISEIDDKLTNNIQILLSSAKQHSDNKEIVDYALKYTFEIIGEPSYEEKKRAKNITKQEIIEIGKQSEISIKEKIKLLKSVHIDYKTLSKKYYDLEHESRAFSILKNLLATVGFTMLIVAIVRRLLG